MDPFAFSGVCTTQHLKRIHYPVQLLNDRIADGDLRLVRHRWYATASASPQLHHAVKQHCLLSGVWGLAHYGGWVPHQPRLQLVQLANRQLPFAEGEVIRSHNLRVSDAPYGIVPWRVALRHGIRHLDLPDRVALIEYLLKANTPLFVPRRELLDYVASRKWGPAVLRHIDPLSESGSETVARVRLVRQGHRVESQALLPNNQRMDLLIDGKVGLEIDSKHHAHPSQYLRDNRKAIVIANQHIIPLRASFHDVMDDWPSVYRAISVMLRTAPHP